MKRFMLALAILLSTVALAIAASGYHLLKKIPVGGRGSWDYLSIDEANRRVYVSHETQVDVLDPDSSKVVGKITNTLGVHGIAIAASFAVSTPSPQPRSKMRSAGSGASRSTTGAPRSATKRALRA